MLMYADDTTLYCNIDQDVNKEVINVELANEEHCFSMISDKVQRTSLYCFKVFIKHRVLDTYKSTCEIVKCKACAIINK